MKTCGNCGAEQKKEMVKFCHKCGSPISDTPAASAPAAPPPTPQASPVMPVCGSCGITQKKENARFCYTCGAPIGAEPPARPAQPPVAAPFQPVEEQPRAVAPPPPPPAFTAPVQRPGQAPPPEAPAYPPPPPPPAPVSSVPAKQKKASGGKLAIIVVALVVVAAVGGFFVYGNRLKAQDIRQVTEFVQAIRRKNVSTIREMVNAPDLVLNESSLMPLFKMADVEGGRYLSEMEAELRGQMEGNASARYQSGFGLESKKTMLFFTTHSIVLHPVSVELESDVPGAQFSLNGEMVPAGTAEGLMPGIYDVYAKYDRYGIDLRGATEQIACLGGDTTHFARLDAAEEWIPFDFDDGVVYINGHLTDIEPRDGYLVIIPSVEGMEVTIEAVDSGGMYTAELEVNYPGETTYVDFWRSGDAGTELPVYSAEDEEEEDMSLYREAMVAYYRVYLDAINEQDWLLLDWCTDDQLEIAIERIENPLNQAYLFRYKSIIIDLDTEEYYTNRNDVEMVRLRISLQYDYCERGASRQKWESGGNIQWCEFVRTGPEEWLCNFTEVKDSDTLSDNTITIN